MNDVDCFIFVEKDEDTESEDGYIRFMCIDCHEKNYSKLGWFYKGSEQGYGPWKYSCCKCDEIIHQHKEENVKKK